MRRHFITADVFTDQPFGGNPLAVLPDGDGLTTAQMQQIAREFNLSETVFVLPPKEPRHARKLRIFTPAREVPFAGHPTVGTALVLARTGALALNPDATLIVLEENAGPVPVTIVMDEGRPVSATLSAPAAPLLKDAPDLEIVARLLTLAPEEVILARIASTGNPFMLVEVADRAALGRARFDSAIAAAHLQEAFKEASWPFIFTRDAAPGFDLQARMFAPDAGIIEDSATGSAAAAFGGWLGLTGPTRDGVLRRVIAQGVEMGRPSRLEVAVEKRDGEVVDVRVGGSAVLISEGEIEIPSR
jgi:trans-2,3-dihydro-3-hydroxyanthranilate isomerase